jgi:hypothetical protein
MTTVPKPGDAIPLQMRLGAALIGGSKALGLSKPLLRLANRQLMSGKFRERAFAGTKHRQNANC